MNARIPLRVVEGALPSWQNEVAKELATPFDSATAPLRAVLVRNDKGATLILASHHSVADGMGAALCHRRYSPLARGREVDTA